eukprot:scaffold23063_cov102-Isochrysis_galbana.AAC.3
MRESYASLAAFPGATAPPLLRTWTRALAAAAGREECSVPPLSCEPRSRSACSLLRCSRISAARCVASCFRRPIKRGYRGFDSRRLGSVIGRGAERVGGRTAAHGQFGQQGLPSCRLRRRPARRRGVLLLLGRGGRVQLGLVKLGFRHSGARVPACTAADGVHPHRLGRRLLGEGRLAPLLVHRRHYQCVVNPLRRVRLVAGTQPGCDRLPSRRVGGRTPSPGRLAPLGIRARLVGIPSLGIGKPRAVADLGRP